MSEARKDLTTHFIVAGGDGTVIFNRNPKSANMCVFDDEESVDVHADFITINGEKVKYKNVSDEQKLIVYDIMTKGIRASLT